METLKDFIPNDAQDDNYDLILKYGDLKILKKLDGTKYPFPKNNNNYRHIFNWCLLENGGAIGWNESPRNGWSFIYIGKIAVDNFYLKNINIKRP